jgi:hypothetical protein
MNDETSALFKTIGGFSIMAASVGALAWFVFSSNSENLGHFTVRLWMAGAGSLGLVSGLITGLSDEDGSGKAFMTFIGTGLLVPILGGVAALLGHTETVTEKSAFLNNQLVKKTTETASSLSDSILHPLAVLGSFFLAFGILAILGIVGGMLLRTGGPSMTLYK